MSERQTRPRDKPADPVDARGDRRAAPLCEAPGSALVKLQTARDGPLLHVAMNTLERSLDVQRVKELQPASHGEYTITLHNGVRLHSGRTYHAKVEALADNSF
jgi:hypothetical protein